MGLFQLKGGLHMRKRRSYTASLLGVVAALVPASPLWLISMPLGIWALILLQRDDVRNQFEDRRSSAYRTSAQVPPTAGHTGLLPMVAVVALLLVVGSLACLGLLFGLYHFTRSEATLVPASRVIELPALPPMPNAPRGPQPPPRTLVLPEAPEPPTIEIRQSAEKPAGR